MIAQAQHPIEPQPDGKVIPFPGLSLRASVMQENLIAGLKALSASVDTRNKLPALQCVHIQSERTALTLSATDLDTAFQISVGARIETSGAAVVYFDTLRDLVALLTPERVDLTNDPDTATLTLRCGCNRSSHKGLPASEFPRLPSAENAALLGLFNVQELRTEIDRLAKLGNSRSNVRLSVSNSKLLLVTSDGHQGSMGLGNGVTTENAFQMNLFTLRNLIKKLPDMTGAHLMLSNESTLGFGDWIAMAWIHTAIQPIVAEKPYTIAAELVLWANTRQLLNAKTQLILDFQRGEVVVRGDSSETVIQDMRENVPAFDGTVTLQGEQLAAALKLLRSIIGTKSKKNPDGQPVWFGITTDGEAAIAAHISDTPRQWTIFRRIIVQWEPQDFRRESVKEEDIIGVTTETVELTNGRCVDLSVSPAALFTVRQPRIVRWQRATFIRRPTLARLSLKPLRVYSAVTWDTRKNWQRDAMRHLLYKRTGQFSTGSWNVDATAIRRAIAFMRGDKTAVYDAQGRALKAGSKVVNNEDGELYTIDSVDLDCDGVTTSCGVQFFSQECQRVAHTSASHTVAEIRKAQHAYYQDLRIVKIEQTAKAERSRYGRSKPAQYRITTSDDETVDVDQYGKLFTIASIG